MADSIPPSQDKKRLKKCNFSRKEIVLIQREVGKNYTIIKPAVIAWLNFNQMII
jgi:hypothetical protein